MKCMIADFSQLCGRLAVFVLFRGEFWSVKFIETRVLKNKVHEPKRDQLKQTIEKENRNGSAIGLCTTVLILCKICV